MSDDPYEMFVYFSVFAQPVSGLSSLSVTKTSLEVTWAAPSAPSELNMVFVGVLQEYQITCFIDLTRIQETVFVPPTISNYTFYNLSAGTRYMITVWPLTKYGGGASTYIYVTTVEDGKSVLFINIIKTLSSQ